MFKYINQISEQSFIIDFGEEINVETNTIVNFFAKKIIDNYYKINELNIKNVVPSYNKILIQMDPIKSNKSKIIKYIKSIKIIENQLINKKIIEIPICYDDIFGLDLNNISKLIELPKKQIINEHLNTLFHVYMIGFMPGLPFMGNTNNLNISRKDTPRVKVPKGSVGIVDNLCVIYPQASPGGWNIVGRTPINIFFEKKNKPLLIEAGDKVKFKKISIKDFYNYGQ